MSGFGSGFGSCPGSSPTPTPTPVPAFPVPLDGAPGSDAFPIPGTKGDPGTPGRDGASSLGPLPLDGAPGASSFPIPGPAGRDAVAPPASPLALDGRPGFDAIPIPGTKGDRGLTGLTGPAGSGAPLARESLGYEPSSGGPPGQAIQSLDPAEGLGSFIRHTLAGERMWVYDDCFDWGAIATTGALDGGVVSSVSGTNAAAAGVAATSGHPGLIQLTTGTTATGKARLISNRLNVIVLGVGGTTFEGVLMITTLSDGTETFTVRCGFGDTAAATGVYVDGVFFRYTHSVNGGRWEAVCRAAGAETAADTGITVDTSFHRFTIIIDDTGSQADFYIDGVFCVSVFTNIPTGANITGLCPADITKSLGGTARLLTIDNYAYLQLTSR